MVMEKNTIKTQQIFLDKKNLCKYVSMNATPLSMVIMLLLLPTPNVSNLIFFNFSQV